MNVSDPLNPALLRTISVTVNQVEAVDGIAYAAVGSQLYSYDLLTGERLQTLPVGSGNITGIAREGSFLHTMDTSLVLRAIELTGQTMAARGSLAMPSGGGKIFVGSGVAYIGAEGAFPGGFSTANVSNPNALALLSGVDAVNVAGKTVVANGSGLAITVGSPGNLGNLFHILNISDPTNSGTLITQFTLPADPSSVAIGAGIAFVADGTAGLQVVNYLSLDNKEVAPTVTMDTTDIDVDPVTAGIQVIEGSLVPLRAQILDDVQMRSVELLVNGQVVRSDVSLPFDLTAAMPTLTSGVSTVSVQVRAADTGGNVGVSAPLTFQLVLDTVPPQLVNIDPPDGGVRGQSFRAVTLTFSEPLDAATVIAANFQLFGPAGLVLPSNIQVRANASIVQLTYPVLPIGSYQVTIDAAAVKDRAGNALGTNNLISSFNVLPFSIQWINTTGGSWDDPRNWSTGVVPTATDDVYIDVPGDVSIGFNIQGSSSIRSLRSKNKFELFRGGLDIATTIQVDNTLELYNGTLKSATILAGSGAASVVAKAVASPTLDGVTLGSDMTVENGTELVVTNGLTLSNHAKLTLVSDQGDSSVYFNGSQTFGGMGEVIFGGPRGLNFIYAFGITETEPAVLTIGPGITVHGSQSGYIQAYHGLDRVINRGTISAETAGQTITLFGSGGFSNDGTMRAINGANLSVDNLTDAAGLAVAGGGTLSLGGTWFNSGSITATASTLTLSGTWRNIGAINAVNSTVNLGGNFTLSDVVNLSRSGGTVNLTGTLDNTGSTLTLNASTGSWQFGGGTIKGGSIAVAGGTKLLLPGLSSGTLDGTTLETDLAVQSGAYLFVKNGLNLNSVKLAMNGSSANTFIYFQGVQTLGGSGELLFSGNGVNNEVIVIGGGSQATAATLTIGSGILVHGDKNGYLFCYYDSDAILNQGIISADTSGTVIFINGSGPITNQGTMQASAGTLSIDNFAPNAGILRAGVGGRILFDESFDAGVGTISIDIAGTAANQYGTLSVGDAVTLGGTLNLLPSSGFNPPLGATFRFLTFDSRLGQWTTVNGNAGTGKQFTVSYGPNDATAAVVSAAAPTAIVIKPVDSSSTSSSSGATGSPASTGTGTVPQISGVTRTTGGAGFQFSTVAGRRYRLEGTDDLARGQWTVLVDDIEGTGTALQVIDSGGTSLRRYFYRIITLP